MVGPTVRAGNRRYEYDAKSFFAGIRAGRGIKGHGEPDIDPESAVPLPSASGGASGGEWRYDNRSFKLGLAVGFALRIPGQGRGSS